MERIVDFSNVKETKFLDQEGTYTFKVTGFEQKTSMSGKEFDRYIVESTDGYVANVDLYLVEGALFKYKAFLSAFGIDASGEFDLSNASDKLIGKEFIGVVKRRKPTLDLMTGQQVESKYFDIVKFVKA